MNNSEIIVKHNVRLDDLTTKFEVSQYVISKTQNNYLLKIQELQDKIEQNNLEINRLTNNADKYDYTVAVISGIISGLVDAFFVGDISFEQANKWGNQKTEEFVAKIAKNQGYKGDDLQGAVKFLENKYPIISDKAKDAFGGGYFHHLRDFSHHPTLIGLFFSVLTQFTKTVYGTDKYGNFKTYKLTESDLIGKNMYEKITFGVINWFFHMISDMAGSYGSISKRKLGTGIPGPLVSLLKEISAIPFFKNIDEKGYINFSKQLQKLFDGTLLGKRDEYGNIVEAVKFDLRTEIGLLPQVTKQSVPILINECVVRGFYFIRHLCLEIKKKSVTSISELENIDWKRTLPFNNRTIVRMLTISLGTFVAVDLADATIESAIKSGGINAAEFAVNMVVKVNFVGVGRFFVAIGSDVGMGLKRNKRINDTLQLVDEQISIYNQLNADKMKKLLDNIQSCTAKNEIILKDLNNDFEKQKIELQKISDDIDERLGDL